MNLRHWLLAWLLSLVIKLGKPTKTFFNITGVTNVVLAVTRLSKRPHKLPENVP